MQAVVITDAGVKLQDRPRPEVGAGEALVEVHAAGICGTDLAIIAGTLPAPKPLTLGHELAGVVIEVGPGVDPAWIDKRVTSEINMSTCGECYFCTRGIPTQCPHRKAIGIDIDGCFAQYIAVEARLLHELPTGLGFEEGTFIEPLAAAVQTFKLRPLTSDDKTIVVFGPGKLGLLIVQVARALAPDARVIVVGREKTKLALAREVGAHETIDSTKTDPVTAIKGATGEVGADVAIETTGDGSIMQDVISATRSRGSIYLKSTHGVATPVNTTELVVREINLYTSRCGPFQDAIDLIKADKIQLTPLISRQFALSQIHEALSFIKTERPVKIILQNEV